MRNLCEKNIILYAKRLDFLINEWYNIITEKENRETLIKEKER
jgi:hypothetical protein